MSVPQQSEGMKRVVVLTGSELRHTFFRKWLALSPGIDVTLAVCEGLEKSLGKLVETQAQTGSISAQRTMHLRAREQSEEDFFRLFVDATEDRSRPLFVAKGEVNSPGTVAAILGATPDVVVCYGASIIREPLLGAFPGRFLNIHLGLSPYYRGSGTNFWPLVNGEPEYVGTTFMHIDAGVDTGEVIHQVRARIAPGDTAVQLGNRLIVDTVKVCAALVRRWEFLVRMPQFPRGPQDRIYKKKDYTEESVERLYSNFRSGLVETYLAQAEQRCAAVPIVQNPCLAEVW